MRQKDAHDGRDVFADIQGAGFRDTATDRDKTALHDDQPTNGIEYHDDIAPCWIVSCGLQSDCWSHRRYRNAGMGSDQRSPTAGA